MGNSNLVEKLAVVPLESSILVTTNLFFFFLSHWLLESSGFILVAGVNVQTGEEVAVKLVIKLFFNVRDCLRMTFVITNINGKTEFDSHSKKMTLTSFLFCFVWISLLCFFLPLLSQESVKTKHPQLHYESKLYMLLQGGSIVSFFF